MAIKIFQGMKLEQLESVINEFEKNHNVFATQHSTVCTPEGVVITTFVVFYKEPLGKCNYG